MLNHVIASFTDNRNEGGGGADSVDIYATGKAIGSTGGGALCDVETSNAIYFNGDQITLATLRYANLTGASLETRLRLQLSFDPFFTGNIIDVGAGGGFVLPIGADFDLGPLGLITVSAGFPRGTWSFRCAMEDPISGAIQAEDTVNFEIQ